MTETIRQSATVAWLPQCHRGDEFRVREIEHLHKVTAVEIQYRRGDGAWQYLSHMPGGASYVQITDDAGEILWDSRKPASP
jgi:hypothetical protein